MVKIKIKIVRRLIHHFPKCLHAVFPDEAIRIMRCRYGHHAHGQFRFQQRIKGSHGRLLSRGIRIKTQHYLGRVAFEDARMSSRERRALRRHGLFQPRHVAGHCVQLPFTYERGFRGQDFPTRLVQPVEDLALVKQQRLRRVHVLRRFHLRVQHATAKANHAALFIMDGKHQPATKPPIPFAVLVGDQTGFLHQFQVKLLGQRPIHCVFPRFRGVPELKSLRCAAGHAAGFQIIPRGLPARFVH